MSKITEITIETKDKRTKYRQKLSIKIFIKKTVCLEKNVTY